jgi:hypothetical protein
MTKNEEKLFKAFLLEFIMRKTHLVSEERMMIVEEALNILRAMKIGRRA